MAPLASRRIPIIPAIVAVAVVLTTIVFLFFLARPAKPAPEASASAEAKAYLPNLALSDVAMQATENFMQQQVVEIHGKLTNNGPRPLQSVEVYCLFSGVDGRQIYREKLPIVPPSATALHPGETRSFRMPFDTLPDGWNQALPKMVIAKISFVR